MVASLRWRFPLPRTHTGMLLGNALLGAMIWGSGDTLNITLGRADVWDHRGGTTWSEAMSLQNIRAKIQRGEQVQLDELFAQSSPTPDAPLHPTMLPLGRFELHWPGAELRLGKLVLRRGELLVLIKRSNSSHTLRMTMLPDEPMVLVSLPVELRDVQIRRVSSWEHVSEKLTQRSIAPPQLFEHEQITGWSQELPSDPAYCVACQHDDDLLTMTVARGPHHATAQAQATTAMATTAQSGFASAAARASQWWKNFWQRAARVTLPNKRLQFLHDYGLYKFAAMTNPHGVPAGLQGPWIEEYQLPPWSADYHFNINVQLCYQPAYSSNSLDHLRPLFDMIHRWTDKLRHNARLFAGVEDGRLLPHAVTDAGDFIPGYWAHSLDQGSTAWVAQMMYRYYRFTLDRDFLRDIAYPFMLGTLRVYQAMLQREESGQYRLDLGVSPEYFDAQKRGYGPNASFQLAAIHRLLEDVLGASRVLEQSPDPQWTHLQNTLPRAALIGPQARQRIALWEAQDLDESHRHHSHLAGLAPFDIIDIDDSQWHPIIERTLRRWIDRGMGQWGGWSFPWASVLHSRVGNAEAAVLCLELFERFFTNEGHGSRYCPTAPGLSLIGIGSMPRTTNRPEIMQCDGAAGAVAAIHEMLLHSRRDVVHLFAGVPTRWRNVTFTGMRTEGAFLVSAARKNGHVQHVTIHSLNGGRFKLANCFAGHVSIHTPDAPVSTMKGPILELHLHAGQHVTLTPSAS